MGQVAQIEWVLGGDLEGFGYAMKLRRRRCSPYCAGLAIGF